MSEVQTQTPPTDADQRASKNAAADSGQDDRAHHVASINDKLAHLSEDRLKALDESIGEHLAELTTSEPVAADDDPAVQAERAKVRRIVNAPSWKASSIPICLEKIRQRLDAASILLQQDEGDMASADRFAIDTILSGANGLLCEEIRHAAELSIQLREIKETKGVRDKIAVLLAGKSAEYLNNFHAELKRRIEEHDLPNAEPELHNGPSIPVKVGMRVTAPGDNGDFEDGVVFEVCEHGCFFKSDCSRKVYGATWDDVTVPASSFVDDPTEMKAVS